MLELVSTRASVVGCFASLEALEALDALTNTGRTYACRVAPDEVMLVGEAGSAGELVGAAAARATAGDTDAIVLDVTDGWAVWTLAGDATREAFARLSAITLPADGYTQGDVVHVPVRLIALPDRLHLMVPAMWGEHLRERILARCASLGVRQRREPAAWTAPADGGRSH